MNPLWPAPDLVEAIRRDLGGRESDLALVLGSGLGAIAGQIEDPWVREAADLPGYPASTVPGHAGRLLLGRWAGRHLWIVQGRVHLYEGYAVEEVTRYVRLLFALGVRTLILTNAAGSVTREIRPADIVLVRDGINFYFRRMAEPAESALPWRMRGPLSDPGLARLAEETALAESIPLRPGILVSSLGPTYETAAEVALWRRLGGSVASMSTVPEAVQARELGMRCLLFSLVTNFGTGLSSMPLTHEEVVALADQAGGRLSRLLAALVPRI